LGRVKSAWGIALLSIVLSSACAPSSHGAYSQERQETLQLANSYIGHDYWTVSTHVFAVSERLGFGVPVTTASGKLRFDSLSDCVSRMCTFHVTFANGKSGYITADLTSLQYDLIDHEPPPVIVHALYPTFLDRLKPQEAERRRRLPGVLLGMVKMEVLASAWGEPERKEETHTSSYHKEKWLYPDGNALLFVDGRLAKIKN
jgi:hypothetical protein